MQTRDISATAPTEIYRAPFHKWLFDRGLTVAHGARALGLAQQVLRRNLLVTTHADHVPASLATRRKVKVFTDGVIDLEDWPDANVAKADS